MKVIFLDIDGVLNCQPDFRKTKGALRVNGDGCIGIYLPRVKNLARIVEVTGAKIVLVSSWKDHYINYLNNGYNDIYGKYLREKLRKCNLTIYDTTYDYEPNASMRGTGIMKWINTHDVESWVVLDDEIFYDYDTCDVFDHLVKTSFYYGALNEDHVERAIKILNKEIAIDEKVLQAVHES